MDRTTREVEDAILQAVNGVSTDFDLRDLLVGVVRAACKLAGARYGALGVIGRSRRELVEFIAEGIDEDGRRAIGDLPTGRGLLGHLITHHETLRLDDLADHPSSSGFPPNHPPMTSFLGVPVTVRGQVFGNLYLTDKTNGRRFTAADERAVVALSGFAGLAIDHARLLMTAERRARWFEATAALPGEVLRTVRPDDALDAVLRQALQGAAGQVAIAVAPDPDPVALGRFTVRAASGDGTHDPYETLEKVRPTLMLAMASGSTRWADLGDGGVVMTRLSIDALTRGALVVVLPREPYLDGAGDDTDLVANFAGQASLVLERRHTREMQQQLAVLAERNRIARDLHDGVTQRLFALGLQLKILEKGLPEQDRTALRTVMDELDATITEVRRSIVDLRPVDQHRASLRAKVQSLVAEYGPALGRPPVLTVEGPLDTLVEPSVHHHVVAVLREGLSNCARHAGASTVWVAVTATPQRLTCVVSDDGVGPAPSAPRSGLRNLGDRATELGGTLALERRVPSGSTLTWQVPLPAPA
ncbi:GAF domain-containing sensor histidine kinase [Isoptericola sp. BMS4]|uniref:GAF domain-containing sensor histidine kinase n=1 Tax=Isoptericola sp. BMS4 TaxID=2527875 RepID=UPI0014238F27|nr:GAF domain-containing sensor histidine kinase [Isoptericola sp. BMS4]